MALTPGELVGIVLGAASLAGTGVGLLVMVCLAARSRWRRHQAGDLEMGVIFTRVVPQIGAFRRDWRARGVEPRGVAPPGGQVIRRVSAAPANAGGDGESRSVGQAGGR